MSYIGDILPTYDIAKTHSQVVTGCTPEQLYTALTQLCCHEIKLLAPLFFLRLLPDTLRGKPATFDRQQLFLAEFRKVGFALHQEQAPTELVMTLVGKLWRYDSLDTVVKVPNQADFQLFTKPNYIKVATNFAMTPTGTGSEVMLSTETRILATCPRSRRLFGWYWRCISWGSGLLRLSMLAAIARRAASPS